MQQKFSIIVLLSLIIGTIACKKVDIQFGSDFVDAGTTQIIKVDTFGAELSTVFVDSFATSGLGTTLVGGYKDPIFGTIATQTYFQVAPPTYEDIYENVLFDSLTLILKLNRNFYGDTTKPVHIDVSRVTDKIQPYDNGFTLYNVNSFNVDPTVLGSKDVIINPNQTDTIYIKLNPALGQEMFNMFIRKSDTIKTAETFLNYFKGIRISSNNSSQLVFGCSDSAKLRIQYKKKDLYLLDKNIDFTITNKNLHFTNITVDRSTGSANIKDLGNGIGKVKEKSSRLSDNVAYCQSAGSVITKIKFPTVKDLLKAPNYAKILNARLIVRPVAGTYNRTFSLPPSLRLSTTTSLNQIGTDLTQISSSGTQQTQVGNLFTDYTYGVSTAYSYDVTNYIKYAITNPNNDYDGLLMSPPSGGYETLFNRVAIGNKLNNIPNSKIELQIFYAAVK
jgi:hypothetical protein